MFRKNTSGQFICVQGVDATTGGIKSGVTWTVRRYIDGTAAAATGTATEDGTTGWYKFAMSQADTNGNDIGFNFTGTGAVPQTVNIVATAADPTDGVRFGLTALPNAAVSGVGGLLTAPTTANVGLADLSRILGTALTETAGQIAAAFKKFFDKATPTGTINSLPDAVPGAAGGLLLDDVWTDARAAKLDNLDAAMTTRLASASYTAPDNASIASILTQTGTSGVVLSATTQNAIADAFLGRNVAGGSSSGRLIKEALYVLRNKVDINLGIVYQTDDSTPAWMFAVTTTAGNPVSVIDPA